jgi:hypothetical protein
MSYRCALTGLALLTAAAAGPAAAQTLSGPGVFGFYDAASGVFTPTPAPMAAPASGVEGRAVVARTGKFVFNVTITIVSSLGTTTPSCSANVNHSGAVFFSESASGTVAVNGNTATCKVEIPYRWGRASTSSPVSASINVSAFGSGVSRNHSQGLPSIDLPANNATTTRNIAVRL